MAQSSTDNTQYFGSNSIKAERDQYVINLKNGDTLKFDKKEIAALDKILKGLQEHYFSVEEKFDASGNQGKVAVKKVLGYIFLEKGNSQGRFLESEIDDLREAIATLKKQE
jgi:hypothetical protein